MNEIFYYLSINNIIYALFIIISVLIISFLLNKIIEIAPTGSHNDLILEGLRGISCLLVFIAHSYLAISTTGIKSPTFEIQPIYSFEKMGSFGADMFFCLTGFYFPL
ncbi:acyltransferase [Proteus hauseri ATCC 700826]|uniref:Acyltransferase n=1 Tax=Proteus hauseri ATCC 700826 TaxID=1354271 RepID=A0AAJ3HUY8_PROHU|nr:acyltransferase family protein [Proteus hauseri]OAT50314.1 acyltransferase [Proteus hauseri ATCC 700826]